MCGRFTQSEPIGNYLAYFDVAAAQTEPLPPSWNVAPTDRVYAVAEHARVRRLGTFAWGLIPPNAATAREGGRFINARAETLLERPAFRVPFARRRCLVPADGFYEWEERQGAKMAHFFFAKDRAPFAFAGLWSVWDAGNDGPPVRSVAIVTVSPNALLAPIHNRMPAILPPDSWAEWLDRDNDDTAALTALLGPYPEGAMACHAVGSVVNSVRNNVPECAAPLPS